jgi:hypothetical protein
MKMNKKAILGMLVAMVMSLGVMGGINTKSNDSNVMCVSWVTYNNAAQSENSYNQGAWYGVSAYYGSAATTLLYTGAPIAATPAGWVALGLSAICYA